MLSIFQKLKTYIIKNI